MLQPAPKSSSFRQGSRNPGPWPVLSAVVRHGNLPSTLSLDLGTMPSHVFTSLWLDTGIHASMTVLTEVPCANQDLVCSVDGGLPNGKPTQFIRRTAVPCYEWLLCQPVNVCNTMISRVRGCFFNKTREIKGNDRYKTTYQWFICTRINEGFNAFILIYPNISAHL